MSGPSPSQYGFGAPHPGGPGPYAPPFTGAQYGHHTSHGQHGSHGRHTAQGDPSLNAESAYPGTLPPPVDYPPRPRRWPWLAGAVGALALVASGIVGGYIAGRSGVEQPITYDEARAALQNYVDALASGDTEQISRHTLCGLYDAVRDHNLDEQVATINSEAFGEGFERVEVVSVDKMVFASPGAGQALFTVRVTPAGQGEQREDQGVAQVLRDGDEVLVCSYLLRNASY
ncbi:MAG: Rv0361 family membrane protein [Mycobacterium sp.]